MTETMRERRARAILNDPEEWVNLHRQERSRLLKITDRVLAVLEWPTPGMVGAAKDAMETNPYPNLNFEVGLAAAINAINEGA